MVNQVSHSVSSLEISKFLGLEAVNESEFLVEGPSPPDKLHVGCFTLLTRESEFEELFSSSHKNTLSIVPMGLQELASRYDAMFLFSTNPRLSYIKALAHFFSPQKPNGIADSAVLSGEAKLGDKSAMYALALMYNCLL